jgi:uncharacterized membrane protein YjjB (DUF3815 family)
MFLVLVAAGCFSLRSLFHLQYSYSTVTAAAVSPALLKDGQAHGMAIIYSTTWYVVLVPGIIHLSPQHTITYIRLLLVPSTYNS